MIELTATIEQLHSQIITECTSNEELINNSKQSSIKLFRKYK